MNYDVEFTFKHTPYTIILVVNTYMYIVYAYTRRTLSNWLYTNTSYYKSYYRDMCIVFSLIIIDA